ncbi:hypothetical protein COLO4_36341 [Corchorus olitorius]|uniref:Uncharacterized protein n=1 Tax=Corchorus olitorius TaxID=93759 RepID=A0A1R3G9Q2_9ROSI|nr:hypothetical protein COLO4_36341 [Corchorus olitorius]
MAATPCHISISAPMKSGTSRNGLLRAWKPNPLLFSSKSAQNPFK